MSDLTEELRVGTRALEGIIGFEGPDDPTWSEDLQAWILPCRLNVNVPQQIFVPSTTSWWIRIEATYPAGRLDFFPAKDAGIIHTFPHQYYNGEGGSGVPWRTGNLCLRNNISSLKRYGFGVEPMEAEERLRWNIKRAQQWLVCAARGELLASGDRFELPDFPQSFRGHLVFDENALSFSAWQQIDACYGYVRTLSLVDNTSYTLVSSFVDHNENCVLPRTTWGKYLQEKTVIGATGVWIRISEVPVSNPWQAPVTWAELVKLLYLPGFNIRDPLPSLLERISKSHDESKSGKKIFMVGFPIPEIVGGDFKRMHWVGFEMPALAQGKEAVGVKVVVAFL